LVGTFATWFGVPAGNMKDVIPNATNWPSLDLGVFA
jgi:hypothetical protein